MACASTGARGGLPAAVEPAECRSSAFLGLARAYWISLHGSSAVNPMQSVVECAYAMCPAQGLFL